MNRHVAEVYYTVLRVGRGIGEERIGVQTGLGIGVRMSVHAPRYTLAALLLYRITHYPVHMEVDMIDTVATGYLRGPTVVVVTVRTQQRVSLMANPGVRQCQLGHLNILLEVICLLLSQYQSMYNCGATVSVCNRIIVRTRLVVCMSVPRVGFSLAERIHILGRSINSRSNSYIVCHYRVTTGGVGQCLSERGIGHCYECAVADSSRFILTSGDVHRTCCRSTYSQLEHNRAVTAARRRQQYRIDTRCTVIRASPVVCSARMNVRRVTVCRIYIQVQHMYCHIVHTIVLRHAVPASGSIVVTLPGIGCTRADSSRSRIPRQLQFVYVKRDVIDAVATCHTYKLAVIRTGCSIGELMYRKRQLRVQYIVGLIELVTRVNSQVQYTY